MASFNDAIKELLPVEGGYANSTSDRGGETKFGISKRRYPHLDIKNLTLQDAVKLYHDDFWECYRLGEIDSQPLANYIFDMLVNHGEGSIRVIQQGCNDYRDGALSIDGAIGSKTIDFFNGLTICESSLVLDKIRLRRIAFYLKIVTNDRSQLANLISWLGRALK